MLTLDFLGLSRALYLYNQRPGAVSGLFDYLPKTLYFAKDREPRLMAGKRAFVERCGFSSEEEMLGCRDHEIFPIKMAEKYQADDLNVIRRDEPLLEVVELFITDKIPLHFQTGEVWQVSVGWCGVLRVCAVTFAPIHPAPPLNQVQSLWPKPRAPSRSDAWYRASSLLTRSPSHQGRRGRCPGS